MSPRVPRVSGPRQRAWGRVAPVGARGSGRGGGGLENVPPPRPGAFTGGLSAEGSGQRKPPPTTTNTTPGTPPTGPRSCENDTTKGTPAAAAVRRQRPRRGTRRADRGTVTRRNVTRGGGGPHQSWVSWVQSRPRRRHIAGGFLWLSGGGGVHQNGDAGDGPCLAGGDTPPPPTHPLNGTGNSPVSGTADPRSSQTGQVIRGLR